MVLLSILDLFKDFNRVKLSAETRDDLVTIITQSGLRLRHENEIRRCLPHWIAKSKRYNVLASELGFGGICVLPSKSGDLLYVMIALVY